MSDIARVCSGRQIGAALLVVLRSACADLFAGTRGSRGTGSPLYRAGFAVACKGWTPGSALASTSDTAGLVRPDRGSAGAAALRRLNETVGRATEDSANTAHFVGAVGQGFGDVVGQVRLRGASHSLSAGGMGPNRTPDGKPVPAEYHCVRWVEASLRRRRTSPSSTCTASSGSFRRVLLEEKHRLPAWCPARRPRPKGHAGDRA